MKMPALVPVKRAIALWNAAGGRNMSAAMSFYGILSLAPLLLLVVGLLGWMMDRETLEQGIVSQLGAIVGAQGGALIESALASSAKSEGGFIASVVGFVVLVFGATGVFGELQEALARLWATDGAPKEEKPAWWRAAALRLRGIGYVLIFGFLLLVSLVLSTLLSLFSGWLGESLPIEVTLRLANEFIGLVIAAALFFGLMRMTRGARPPTRSLWVGAFTGAILFTLGRQLMALYLAKAAVVSAYGAAGSVMVLLMWMYFSSAVLLFGAALARALHENDAVASQAGARSSDLRWAPQSARADTTPTTSRTATPH